MIFNQPFFIEVDFKTRIISKIKSNIDLFVILVNKEEKIETSQDIVFYNNIHNSNHSVKYIKENNKECFFIDMDKIENKIKTVYILLKIYNNKSVLGKNNILKYKFGYFDNINILFKSDNNNLIMNYTLSDILAEQEEALLFEISLKTKELKIIEENITLTNFLKKKGVILKLSN